MRVLIILMILIGYSAFGQDNPVNPILEKYRDDERFTRVYISGKMLSLMASSADEEDEEDEDSIFEKDDDEDIKKALSSLSGIQILSSEELDRDESRSLFLESEDLLKGKGYEELMVVKERDQEFLFLIKEENNQIDELILLGYETEECCGESSFFLLTLYGIIDLKSISDVGDALDIEGLEKLEKLEE